jgi:hypothetical protein
MPGPAMQGPMSRGAYADFRPPQRFDRAVRVMVLATGAALVGVIAGGVTVFAIVTALTAPLPRDVRADAGSAGKMAETSGPVVAAVPPAPSEHPVANAPTASATTPAATPATTPAPRSTTNGPASSAAPVQEQVQELPPASTQRVQLPNSWPDALSRAHPAETKALPDEDTRTPTATMQIVPAHAANDDAANDQDGAKPPRRTDVHAVDGTQPASGLAARAVASRSATSQRSAHNPEPAKSRTTVTSRAVEPAANETVYEPPAERTRSLFDFFDDRHRQGDQDAVSQPDAAAPRGPDSARSAKSGPAKPRIARPRRPSESDDQGWDDGFGHRDEWVGDWHH